MALTELQIKRAHPRDRAYSIGDGGGLYLWVTPPGGKLWRWSYRFDGKEKLMALGRYPDVSLALARDRHREARTLLATGIDPMAQRKTDKLLAKTTLEDSFQSIASQWMNHWKEGKSPRHVGYVQRRMETDILPFIGGRPITKIESPELVALAKAIEQRGARDIAKRALETLGQIFRFSIAHGYSRRNPATEVKPRDILKPTRKTNYARIDAKDLADLLQSIEVYQGTHKTRIAMELLAMTFVRTTELIAAKWSEFDLDRARWDIPAERMKMRTPHIVPLARQVLQLLASLHRLTGHQALLFPGDRDCTRPMSNNTILKALERMGFHGKMTGHGFRGLASTILHEQGYAHEHIELQLAHTQRNSVSAAYNHALYVGPRTQMMQDWADYLEATRLSGKLATNRKTADATI